MRQRTPSLPGRTPPAAHEAAFQRALTCVREGRIPDAMHELTALLERAPTHGPARNVLGVLRMETGDAEGALSLLAPLARETPQAAAVQVNYGNALVAANRAPEAIDVFARVVAVEPALAANWYGFGRALQLSGRHAECIDAYDAVLARDPSHITARANLSAALNFLDRFREGEAHARIAVQHAPHDAGAHFNLGCSLLSQQRWAEGWGEFEWRSRTPLLGTTRPAFTSPDWDGSAIAGGTLVVFAEQGFGDTLQYARYLPLLRSLGMRVVLVCQRPLVRILHSSGLANEVVPLGAVIPMHTAHVSLSSVPHRLRLHTTADVTVHNAPYLAASATPASCAASASASATPAVAERSSGSRRRVGLVWAGHPGHVNDVHRSCGLESLSSLFDVPDIDWVSLQVGPRAKDRERLGLVDHLADGSVGVRDFADTARILGTLDLVITVDSAVAHLAGAMGRSAVVLLPRVGLDWRWVGAAESGGATPWYGSVQCLRQAHAHDWSPVVSALRSRLSR